MQKSLQSMQRLQSLVIYKYRHRKMQGSSQKLPVKGWCTDLSHATGSLKHAYYAWLSLIKKVMNRERTDDLITAAVVISHARGFAVTEKLQNLPV